MRKLSEIFEAIKQAKSWSTKDLADVPLANRPGASMLIENAKQELPGLHAEVAKATIPSRLVGVFSDNAPDAVASFLRANDGLVLDVDLIWQRIADRIEPSYSDERAFRITQHNLMIHAVSDLARELGFNQLDVPSYVEKQCLTRQDTIDYVRDRVRSVIGDELQLRFFKDAITDAVIQLGLDDKRIPVLVRGSVPEERAALSGLFIKSGTYEFSEDFKVTKDSVTTIFKAAA